MAGDHLIDDYLRGLRGRLPAEAVEELADGLAETHRRHRAAGLDPVEAARAAIAEFGEPDAVLAAFVRLAPGRRAALWLLGSGPLVGGSWAVSLVAGRAWAWPVPPVARVVFGCVLAAVVVLLAFAATGRRSLRRTRLAAAAGLGVIGLDVTIVGLVTLTATSFVWPMAVAVPASLLRLTFTARSLPRIVPVSPTRTWWR